MKNTSSYFFNEFEASAFAEAFTLLIAKRQKDVVSQYMSPENTHRFRHGGGWSHPGLPEITGGDMQELSSVIETQTQDFVDNNLDVIEHAVRHLVADMERQFAQMFYSTISAACDQSGNTIDAKSEGSLTDAFIAMIEKIQFSADKNGNVAYPELHAGPETVNRMVAELEAAPPEYRERVDAITARKTAEALEREAKRKAKFARYGDEA